MLVCPLPTVEPAVFFPLTPIAAAVKQALFEQQIEQQIKSTGEAACCRCNR